MKGERRKNTIQAIRDAFISLLAVKQIESITVTELVKKAQVSRSAFYLHYKNSGDILSSCAEEVSRFTIQYIEKHSPENIRQAILEICEKVKLNHAGFKALLLQGGNSFRYKLYTCLFSDPTILKYISFIDPVMNKYSSLFFFHGIVGILTEWVVRGCNDDPNKILDGVSGLPVWKN